MPQNIVVFASGSGTNFRAICDRFQGSSAISVSRLVTNKPDCGAVGIAEAFDVPVHVLTSNELNNSSLLTDIHPDLIVLAGFLKKIPGEMVHRFSGKIINLHPSLLPKYGGKGMFGMHVHRAVLENGETTSGITIHRVNEAYDEGETLFQKQIDISDCKTPEQLAARIQELEHYWYPRIIEKELTGQYHG